MRCHAPPSTDPLRRAPGRCAVSLAQILAAAALWACGSDKSTEPPPQPPPPPPVPTALTAVAGDGQSGPVAQPLALSPTVRVTDQRSQPMAGVSVSFVVSAGGGSVSAQTVATDAQGQAAVTWTLGTAAGAANNRLTASLAALPTSPVTFTATALAGPIRSVRIAGDAAELEGPPGGTLPALTVATRDAYGNPTPDRQLTWTVTGGGTVSGTTATRADGTAEGRWVLGASGPQRLTVSDPGAADSAAVFTAALTGQITGTISLDNAYRAPAAAPVDRPPRAAARGAGVAGPEEYVPDELLVIFRGPALGLPEAGARALGAPAGARAAQRAMTEQLARLAASRQLTVRGTSPVLLTARVKVPAGQEVAALMAALVADPAVAAVERNHIARSHALDPPRPAAGPVVPSDPRHPHQAWHYAMVGAPEAWSITTGDPGIVVAVVDDGVRFDHPDLAGQLTSDGYDFVSTGSLPRCGGGVIDRAGDGDGPDPDPTVPARYGQNAAGTCLTGLSAAHGHGTHVAGTIGARAGNGVLGTGVAWQVRIRPVRVLDVAGSGVTYEIAQGILYAAGLPADDGRGGVVRAGTQARIINLSLGGSAPSAVLQLAVQAAAAAGSLLIASAGNDGTSVPMYPAAYPEVVSVAAVDPFGDDALYSNYGSTIDISAPGGDTFFGEDYGVFSTLWNFADGSPAFGFLQGTSMAAPHVSGVAALVLAREPGLSATQLRNRLEAWAVDVRTPGWDAFTGAGIVNARNSLLQNVGPARSLRVRAINAQTGQLRPAVAATAGIFSLTVPEGLWHVFAGEDADGDGLIGLPGRRWGAIGPTDRPLALAVGPGAAVPASFTVGWPTEEEPNQTAADATYLPVDGYTTGLLAVGESDLFRFQLARPANVVVETLGHLGGACGFTRSANTRLTLLGADQAILATNDDIDPTAFNLCSRISTALQPGTYYLRVEASPMTYGSPTAKRYQVRLGTSP